MRPDPAPVEDFASRLRRLREAASLTQEELGDRAGLTGKAVGALERGERRHPYPNTIRALAQVLKLDGDESEAFISSVQRKTNASSSPEPNDVVRSPGLVGRQHDTAAVIRAFASGTRLVTVTGPGGVGKTSLARAVANEMKGFERESVIVELAAVAGGPLLMAAVSAALGLRTGGEGGVFEALTAYLGDRRQLLVLDNFEHLLDEAPQVANLLNACTGLVILTTSRAPLRVRLEREYALKPLAVPVSQSFDHVQASAAVQMFVERARAVSPSFVLGRANAAAVGAICTQLDGLPLALELTAAHVRFLPPEALLVRLTSTLNTARARDLPERQATMRATLDWSHELATATEQKLFRRLSIFAGPFPFESAEAIAGDDVDAFAALSGLVEQSLVEAQTSNATFRLLEPVRQYAQEKLQTSNDLEATQQRHFEFYCVLASAGRDGLRGGDQAAWLDRLDIEQANVRVSLMNLLAHDRHDLAASLLADTWLYWALRGRVSEAISWTKTVDSALVDSPAKPRALVALARAGLHYASGAMAATFEASTFAVEHLGADLAGLYRGEAQLLQGASAAFLGDGEAAAHGLHAALQHGREQRSAWVEVHAKIATALWEMSAAHPDSLRRAGQLLEDAEPQARQLANPFSLATLLNARASLFLAIDDDERALHCLREAVELADGVRTTWTLVYTLADLGVLAMKRQHADVAATFFAASAETTAQSSLVVAFPPDRAFADQFLDAARQCLDDKTFQQAWRRGHELDGQVLRDLMDVISRPVE